GLRLLDGGDMRREVGHAELREQLQHELHVRVVALQYVLIGLPAVVAVGVVVADAGDGLDAFEVLRRQHPGDDGLDLVVDASERPLRVGHRFLDALLRGAIPREPRRPHVLRDGPQGKRHGGGNPAQHDLDLLLEDELPVALDGVLWIRFLLDDELNLAAEDAAGLVHALGPPLGATEAGRADGRGDTSADGQDADLHGVGWDTLLRLRSRSSGQRHRGQRCCGGSGTLDERASTDVHAFLRDREWTTLSKNASMIEEDPLIRQDEPAALTDDGMVEWAVRWSRFSALYSSCWS